MKHIRVTLYLSSLFLLGCAETPPELSRVDFSEYNYSDSKYFRDISDKTYAVKRTYEVAKIAKFDISDECLKADISCTSSKEVFFKTPEQSGLYWVEYEGNAFPINVVDLSEKKACLLINSFTDQAYNKTGGHNFYTTPYDKKISVSLGRPITSGNLEKSIGAHTYTFPMYDLANKIGLKLHVFDDLFLHKNSKLLKSSCSSLIFSQHPEYWTKSMRLQIKDYIKNGNNIFNASANIAYWEVSLDTRKGSITVDKRIEQLKSNRTKFFDAEVTSLFGGYYIGYPVKRYAKDEAVFKRKYPVLSELPEFTYSNLRKMTVVDESSSIFHCLKSRENLLTDVPLKFELDGVSLSEFTKGAPEKQHKKKLGEVDGALITAWTLYGKKLKNIVVARDYVNQYGGRVMTFGSIGWADISMKNKVFNEITKSALAEFSGLEYNCE